MPFDQPPNHDSDGTPIMQAHRVYYMVSWELPPEQRGTGAHLAPPNPDLLAEEMVRQRIASGLPIKYEFLRDEHDFGNDCVACIGKVLPWEPTPSEVLRMIADQIDLDESEELGDTDDEDADCEP